MILKSFLALSLLAVTPVFAGERANIATDDASQTAYSSGWKSGDNGGSGFGPWTLQCLAPGQSNSYAGCFIATVDNNPDSKAIATQGKSFGMFANGTAFEASTGYRPFEKPLPVGSSFSLLMQHGDIVKKFDNDPGGGAIGITLRTGTDSASPEDYNKQSRFEFGYYGAKANYQIYDGEESHDSGVAFTDGGLTITVTLVTADTYDLEITTMADKKTTKLSGRKLGGAAGGTLDSFCIFDRNGEKFDVFFNGFQVSKEEKDAKETKGDE